MLGGNQPPLPIVTGTAGAQDANTSASSTASPADKKEKTMAQSVEAQ